jgi:hypothetical protein
MDIFPFSVFCRCNAASSLIPLEEDDPAVMCGALAVFQPFHDKGSVAALILQDLQSYVGRQLPIRSVAESNGPLSLLCPLRCVVTACNDTYRV